jgi:hypothetical protein
LSDNLTNNFHSKIIANSGYITPEIRQGTVNKNTGLSIRLTLIDRYIKSAVKESMKYFSLASNFVDLRTIYVPINIIKSLKLSKRFIKFEGTT